MATKKKVKEYKKVSYLSVKLPELDDEFCQTKVTKDRCRFVKMLGDKAYCKLYPESLAVWHLNSDDYMNYIITRRCYSCLHQEETAEIRENGIFNRKPKQRGF